VDKTWGYQKDDEGNVRIILHHSSLPYSKWRWNEPVQFYKKWHPAREVA
jgi:hypothetical protein